jgi:hypothetical protein
MSSSPLVPILIHMNPFQPSDFMYLTSVELYLYSPSGPSWPGLGWTLTLPFINVLLCPQEEDSFRQQTGLKFKEETSKVLHLKHSFVWCWNVDTSENGSEVSWKFWNVVLEKNGDQLDRSREKWRSITQSQRGEEYPTYNKKKKG